MNSYGFTPVKILKEPNFGRRSILSRPDAYPNDDFNSFAEAKYPVAKKSVSHTELPKLVNPLRQPESPSLGQLLKFKKQYRDDDPLARLAADRDYSYYDLNRLVEQRRITSRINASGPLLASTKPQAPQTTHSRTLP